MQVPNNNVPMKKVGDISYSEAEKLLKYLIDESECAIVELKKLKEVYKTNKELVHMYSIKELHYSFMICRLKRHINHAVAPKLWCEGITTIDTKND